MDRVLNIINHFFFSFNGSLIIPLLLFCFSLRFRKYGALRLIACLIPYFLIPFLYIIWMDPDYLATGHTWLMIWAAPGLYVGWYNFSYVIFLAFAMFIVWFCFQADIRQVLFYGSAAYAVQNFGSNFNSTVFYMIFGSRLAPALLSMVMRIAVLVAFYFLCVRRTRKEEFRNLNNVFLSVFLLVVLTVVNIASLWMLGSDPVVSGNPDAINISNSFYGAIAALLLLIVQFGFFDRSKLEQDKAVVENLLQEAGRQQEKAKENVELINLKCHDMKHQLALFRGSAGSAVQQQAIDQLEKTIAIYDASAHTGNETLDIVLSEKILRCEKFGINFTWLADGAAVPFLEAADLYSLFGNALDNAIEAVGKEPEGQRIILLNVQRKGAFVSVSVENTCSAALRFEGGLPQTTKEDTRYHGFGVKSIRYVAEKYGGTVAMRQADGKFYLSILFPARHKN